MSRALAVCGAWLAPLALGVDAGIVRVQYMRVTPNGLAPLPRDWGARG